MLLGASGMLAQDIIRTVPSDASVESYRHADLDIRDTDRLSMELQRSRPDWVINASGYTAVDRAESEPALANEINGHAVGRLAEICATLEVPLLHFSTDYVFDGSQAGYYAEDDETNPVSVYGSSKLLGEQGVLRGSPRNVVLRTQWLYGSTGRSFVSVMADRAQKRQPTRVVDDQFGCCTFAVDLAAVTWTVMAMRIPGGLYHGANRGRLSRFELAHEVFASLGAADAVEPCKTDEFPTPARRPENSALDVDKIERAIGRQMPPWKDALQRYFKTRQG